jgi:hypothetical protein
VDEFGYLSCECLSDLYGAWIHSSASGHGHFRLIAVRSMLISSAWMDNGAGGHDAQDDDEDLRSDPIAQIDLSVSILRILLGASGWPSAGLEASRDRPTALTIRRSI